jgi:branched-chain amino acid aminotransferase
MRLVSIDGVIQAPEEARVSVYDRGFLYGDSVFETIRTYGGEPFALAEHLARLERSAEHVGIPMPLSRAALARELGAILAASHARARGVSGGGPAEPASRERYARVMLTRGSGPLGLEPGSAVAPLRVIMIEPLKAPASSLYRDGVSVIAVRTQRAGDAAHGAKVGNYLASLLALREARAAGAHEALILDAAGHVVEGTTSNVFLVERQGAAARGAGALITPPEEAGILAGITRAHVMELAGELGIPVRCEPVPLARLVAADEVFITSSIREIVPVVRVDAHGIGDGSPGPTTRALHAAFRRKVGLGAAPLPWDGA